MIGSLFHKIILALKKKLIKNSWQQLKFFSFLSCLHSNVHRSSFLSVLSNEIYVLCNDIFIIPTFCLRRNSYRQDAKAKEQFIDFFMHKKLFCTALLCTAYQSKIAVLQQNPYCIQMNTLLWDGGERFISKMQ